MNELDDYKMWKKNLEYISIDNGVLKLKNHKGVHVIVVPKHYTREICELYHDEPTDGHFGYEKTFENIWEKFYWPRMKTEIFKYCSSCDICQKMKPRNKTPRAPLVSIRVSKPYPGADWH